jgi:hypothetical protein
LNTVPYLALYIEKLIPAARATTAAAAPPCSGSGGFPTRSQQWRLLGTLPPSSGPLLLTRQSHRLIVVSPIVTIVGLLVTVESLLLAKVMLQLSVVDLLLPKLSMLLRVMSLMLRVMSLMSVVSLV